MADPFAVVGLAASILTLVEFGSKVISLANSIRESHDGTIPEAEELNLILQHIRSRSSTLRDSPIPRPLSQNEQGVLEMAIKCDQLATELSDILKTLRVRDTARSRTLDAIRVALQAVRKKKTIDNLQTRLTNLDRSLRVAVNEALQQHRDSAIMSELRTLRSLHEDLAIDYDSSLDDIQNDILGLAKGDQIQLLGGGQLLRLKERLNQFVDECRTRRHASEILQRLNFVEMRRRWDRITDTEKNTNTWIFDRAKTGFSDWLETGRGIFWITGKAGSGKSTLMKFVSDHAETQTALTKWAGPKKLHVASYYFWNQGFELQKSQRGLLRTLLFQILKSSPASVLAVCPRLPKEEEWGINELKAMLCKVVKLDNVPAKFCFFIDGLDEFHGDEEDLVEILSFFSDTLDVKLCVSSRPRVVLNEAFTTLRMNLVISDFTKDDMRTYVQTRLQINAKFRKLQASDPACEQIITRIAKAANGVWLWVYLVTHDLLHAINRNEGITMLHKILDQFPEELEDYFKFIIQGVKPPFREEMAQIFLMTMDAAQPLPVFVFSLLERESRSSDYAITAPIAPIDLDNMSADEEIIKDRLQNRCRDLLVVEEGRRPVFLGRRVDFLHRTVRDFLRDCYFDQLKAEVASDFDPLVSLCSAMLFLIKGLPFITPRRCMAWMCELVDELLYYAHKVERRQGSPEAVHHVARVLDEVDHVNSLYTYACINGDWEPIRNRTGKDLCHENKYQDGASYYFLGLAVQAGLAKYVDSKLDGNPDYLYNPSRPLLDYALRLPHMLHISLSFHMQRVEEFLNLEMVSLLLKRGADPNQQVHLHNGKTVWALFLAQCYETACRVQKSPRIFGERWYRACKLLIRHGADPRCRPDVSDVGQESGKPNLNQILNVLVGKKKAEALQKLMVEKKVPRDKAPEEKAPEDNASEAKVGQYSRRNGIFFHVSSEKTDDGGVGGLICCAGLV